MKHLHFLPAVLIAAALVPATAHAQDSDADKAAARDLTKDGNSLIEKRDFAAAADRFTRAESLFHAPTITLGLARARVGLGKLVAAQEAYNRVLNTNLSADSAPAFHKAVADARKELEALTPRIPSVVIEVKGGNAPNVTADNVRVPPAALGVRRLMDPGEHVIRAAAPGFAVSEVRVTLAEGKSEVVRIELKPDASSSGALPGAGPVSTPAAEGAPARATEAHRSSGSSAKTFGFVGLGVGAAGLLVGGITGALVLSKHSTLVGECPGNRCSATYAGDVDSYRTMGTVSTVSFIGGGVLTATGLVLLLTAPSGSAATTAMQPVIGPGYFGVQGSF